MPRYVRSAKPLASPPGERVTITPGTLEDVLRAHADHIKRKDGGRRALLSFADLSGMDLTHRVLTEADLSGAVLAGANLRFAEFVNASLYCCDLRNVDGRYANFTRADMRGGVLGGSNLSHAKLDFADFRAGRMMKSGPGGMQEVVVRDGDCAAVDFSHTSLCGTSFQGARLEGANFSGAIIHAAKFAGARLRDAKFEGTVLSHVDFDELRLPPEVLQRCVLPPSVEAMAALPRLSVKLTMHQRWITSNALEGECAVLDGDDLRPLGPTIGKFKLTAISAKGVIAVSMDFTGCELQGANFEDADLRGASFEGADLRGVRFRNARLNHAKFTGADMRCLHLRSGEHLPCDLAAADVTLQQLEDAIQA